MNHLRDSLYCSIMAMSIISDEDEFDFSHYICKYHDDTGCFNCNHYVSTVSLTTVLIYVQ